MSPTIAVAKLSVRAFRLSSKFIGTCSLETRHVLSHEVCTRARPETPMVYLQTSPKRCPFYWMGPDAQRMLALCGLGGVVPSQKFGMCARRYSVMRADGSL